MPRELQPIETLALARCIKDADQAKARAKMIEGTSGDVDFSVRITGNVHLGVSTKTVSTTSTHEERQPVDLMGFPSLCALLRILNIRPSRIAVALAAVPLNAVPDPKLAAIFEAEQTRRSEALPLKLITNTSTTNGRAGAITTTLTATPIDQFPRLFQSESL